ncbi:hypothetical protein, partial [Lysinibacillus boronitolerans]|uniref:hypothetical protein n=1 Tax=Lysinibacillus boronitolerans TaxID=309788 RepID=UPI003083DF42
KVEDKLNEFDLDAKEGNLKICVNYLFEYYHNYLNSDLVNEKTILNKYTLNKFRKQFEDYEIDVQDWLVHIYDVYEKHIHKSINSLLKKEEMFYLYHTDSDFRSCSYDCYAHLIKKNNFLKDQSEYLFKYIKEYHSVQSMKKEDWQNPFITEEINSWIEDTWVKYKVNIWAFVDDYTNRFLMMNHFGQ